MFHKLGTIFNDGSRIDRERPRIVSASTYEPLSVLGFLTASRYAVINMARYLMSDPGR